MENLDVGLYSVIIVVLFAVLGFGTLTEYNRMDNTSYTGEERADGEKKVKTLMDRLFN